MSKHQTGIKRTGVIALIVLVSILVAAVLIYPSLISMAEIASVESDVSQLVDGNSMGDPNAPIRIEEFGDYRCSHCGTFAVETKPQLVQAYVATGKVYLVYRSFGKFMGPESQQAAEAAYCAGDQNKYWEYQDILFANRTSGLFSDQRLLAFAEDIGLEIGPFESCYSGGKYTDRTLQDYADGKAAGVNGTPSFIISYEVDGEKKQRFIYGARTFSEFQTQIERALGEMGIH